MIKGKYSISLEQAAKDYPVLKQTIKLAEEFGINIIFHFVKFTKRGKVYQHLFVIKDKKTGEKEWHTNQNLLNWLRNCKAYKKELIAREKKFEKDLKEFTKLQQLP
ncbi:MAG: hypothetical protein WC333_02370 [Dehalococcoidia bacterium]